MEFRPLGESLASRVEVLYRYPLLGTGITALNIKVGISCRIIVGFHYRPPFGECKRGDWKTVTGRGVTTPDQAYVRKGKRLPGREQSGTENDEKAGEGSGGRGNSILRLAFGEPQSVPY